MENKTLKICEKGHHYYKSSDCPVCPICEANKIDGFIPKLSSPAKRALMSEGINSIQELARYSEYEILKLHGLGPSSIPILKDALESNGLSFKN